MIIAFPPFLRFSVSPFLRRIRAGCGRRLFFRRILTSVTIPLDGAEYLLTALIVLQSRLGALLQPPVGRLHYLSTRRGAVAEPGRRRALLQADSQKGAGRDTPRDGFITFVARQRFFQTTLVVGVRAELFSLFPDVLGGSNQPVLVLVKPVDGTADGDDSQQKNPADDRKNNCPGF